MTALASGSRETARESTVAWEISDAGDCCGPGDAARLTSSISNPLRVLGLARILAGGWFVATGVATLRQYHDLAPQAARLFGADTGTTGAPMRSLLMLALAIVLVLMGLGLAAKGFAWLRRVRLPPEGPAAIEQAEAVGTLRHRQAAAYGDGPVVPYWPLRRWLPDELGDMTWWRREITSRGVRAFARSCGWVIGLAISCLAVPRIMTDDLLGPFPTSFVMMLPFVTGIWAVLGSMLIGSAGPRVESVEFPLPASSDLGRDLREEQIIESRPDRLDREPPGLGLTLGAAGVAVQCLMLSWWSLSPIDFPLRVTSMIRDAGSIAGGTVFFVIGGHMVAAATKLLLAFRYQSTLILIDAADHGMVVRAAAVRTESLGLTGPRHVVAAVGGSYVRESAERLIAN